jgi:hypothetical protein
MEEAIQRPNRADGKENLAAKGKSRKDCAPRGTRSLYGHLSA